MHASEAARAYAALERRVRAVIEPLTAAVCPGCTSPCCRACYCRPTAENPWYAFVNRQEGSFPVPADWRERRDPFGLGASGCEIRAGRYVYCYSYTCRRLREALPQGAAREAFQAVSDLLRAVNRLPGGRLLHETASSEEFAELDLDYIRCSSEEALAALPALLAEVGRIP